MLAVREWNAEPRASDGEHRAVRIRAGKVERSWCAGAPRVTEQQRLRRVLIEVCVSGCHDAALDTNAADAEREYGETAIHTPALRARADLLKPLLLYAGRNDLAAVIGDVIELHRIESGGAAARKQVERERRATVEAEARGIPGERVIATRRRREVAGHAERLGARTPHMRARRASDHPTPHTRTPHATRRHHFHHHS